MERIKGIDLARFSKTERERLEEKGYIIYPNQGLSVAELKHPVTSKWHKGWPFENERGYSSEMAINPRKLFLPNSDRKGFTRQKQMVEEMTEQLRRDIPGVRAIIAKLPDYISLHVMHLQSTGTGLFTAANKDRNIRTSTITMSIKIELEGMTLAYRGPCFAMVSYFLRGIYIDSQFGELPDPNVWVAPVIIPDREVSTSNSCLGGRDGLVSL